MRIYVSRIGAAVAVLVCFAAPAVPQDGGKHKELPKFHKVNSVLYRGAQPKRGGLERLAKLGIKTILDLRGAGDRARAQEQEAVGLGIRYFNVPIKWYGRPTDQQVDRALQIINAPENHPVFVHCGHGVDRTGLMIAVYRIAQEGWTSSAAKAEAKRLGMHWWKFGLKDYIGDYHRRLSTRTGEKSGSRLLTAN
ncbi:MAG TPA: tyrosine-protein phosphatase [Pyrinomonadaceae bacterium]|nr:tyrosine-protein phosphatase [Pyrinomonadaceae bacterium]